MWSFGCILYELLKYAVKEFGLGPPIIQLTNQTTQHRANSNDKTTIEQDKNSFKKERYLFQGSSCYPLTPIKQTHGSKKGDSSHVNFVGQNDQMNVILRGLGIQTENDLSFLSREYSI